jgi:hypothetical protein
MYNNHKQKYQECHRERNPKPKQKCKKKQHKNKAEKEQKCLYVQNKTGRKMS